MRKYFVIIFFTTVQFSFAQQKKTAKLVANNPLKTIINHLPDSLQRLIANKNNNVQLLYTQINRSKNNTPSFTTYSHQLNQQYFYPASTVKMPLAFLALEKLNNLQIKGLTMHTTMVIEEEKGIQTPVYTQPTAKDSRATIANYIKQIFLVSDNDAYNRLYEFLGQEYIQQKLTEKGYPNAIIRHRLEMSLNKQQNQITNAISFYDSLGNIIYHQPKQISKAIYKPDSALLGKGYIKAGKLVNEPFSFAEKNQISLANLTSIMQAVLFPTVVAANKRFNLTPEDYAFLYQCMSAYPKESSYPNYPETDYWDSYCKFLLYGSDKTAVLPNVRIFNKVGDAYGFLIDVAYMIDTVNKVEFMLSATIACNSDGIFNDSKYDYETVGFPFLKAIGQAVYNYELKRKRFFKPNFRNFTINYAKE
jgi:beta-lactamase class D